MNATPSRRKNPPTTTQDEACPLPDRSGAKAINLALQGGGAHGAFAWGVLDRFLEDGRLWFEGISGTSAGSMNATVLAYGLLIGGRDGARQKLEDFWRSVSRASMPCAMFNDFPGDAFPGFTPDYALGYELFSIVSRWLSPYQFNVFDCNPLRDCLVEHVDFERLNRCQITKLFISATNVRTGRPRIFHTEEITEKAVMASACLPQLFKAVEIDGEHYWDGGYMGNPSLYPFFYHTQSRDLVLVHINPIERRALPTRPTEIDNRINEISFNASLLKEFRAIAFVQKLLEEDWIKEEYRDRLKNIRLHAVRADDALGDLSLATKFRSDWRFLTDLRDRGRCVAAEWLDDHYDCIGTQASVDLRATYLNHGDHAGHDD